MPDLQSGRSVIPNPYLRRPIFVLKGSAADWNAVVRLLRMGRNVTALEMQRYPWRNKAGKMNPSDR